MSSDLKRDKTAPSAEISSSPDHVLQDRISREGSLTDDILDELSDLGPPREGEPWPMAVDVKWRSIIVVNIFGRIRIKDLAHTLKSLFWALIVIGSVASAVLTHDHQALKSLISLFKLFAKLFK